ncbi:MAG TPA: response regulator transcription factor [Longimicrobiales bacterium]|nr:response regulator transcription factor [Longimicrobiales bacterium]
MTAPVEPGLPIVPILLVEDNRLLREGIVAILNREPDLEVVAIAEDSSAALLRLGEVDPRLVLVDAGLADQDGHHAVELIKRAAPLARVVVMDIMPVPEDIVEFVRQGASGFVVKSATVADFVQTVRWVAEGRDVLPPALTGTLLSHLARHAADHPAPRSIGSVRMTKREREVVALVADGHSNKEIARRLHLSIHTVKSHVRNILEKLALHSRLQLAAAALKGDHSGREAE